MYVPKIRVENIRQFRALFQDIDYENIGFKKAEAVYMIWMLYDESKIQKPTIITDSGGGIHIYLRIQNTPY